MLRTKIIINPTNYIKVTNLSPTLEGKVWVYNLYQTYWETYWDDGRIYFRAHIIILDALQPEFEFLPDQYQYSNTNRLIVARKEERKEYLDEKVALAVNGILDDFEGLAIVYMEIDGIFHL